MDGGMDGWMEVGSLEGEGGWRAYPIEAHA